MESKCHNCRTARKILGTPFNFWCVVCIKAFYHLLWKLLLYCYKKAQQICSFVTWTNQLNCLVCQKLNEQIRNKENLFVRLNELDQTLTINVYFQLLMTVIITLFVSFKEIAIKPENKLCTKLRWNWSQKIRRRKW